MTIIQLITELNPAGAERVVANLSIELKKIGHNVSVVSLQPLPVKNAKIPEELKNNGIQVFSLNLTKFTPWRILNLLPIIKQISGTSSAVNKGPTPSSSQPVIVHSHLIHANIAARILKFFYKKFVLINTVHIAERRKSAGWHFVLDKLTLSLCDRQTAVSEAARNHHALKVGIAREAIPVIYNGVKPPAVLGLNRLEALRKEWGVYDCIRVIGSVGRLDKQKGFDIFFRMLPRLSSKIPSGQRWGVVILGEGSQRRLLEKLTMKVPDNIKIVLPGYRDDAASCIPAFNLFVMPSRYEGHPLTFIEATYNTVPILASNIDSIAEVAVDYPACKLVDFETGEADNITDIIIDMAWNWSLSEYNSPFTISKMAEGYCQLYSKYYV